MTAFSAQGTTRVIMRLVFVIFHPVSNSKTAVCFLQHCSVILRSTYLSSSLPVSLSLSLSHFLSHFLYSSTFFSSHTLSLSPTFQSGCFLSPFSTCFFVPVFSSVTAAFLPHSPPTTYFSLSDLITLMRGRQRSSTTFHPLSRFIICLNTPSGGVYTWKQQLPLSLILSSSLTLFLCVGLARQTDIYTHSNKILVADHLFCHLFNQSKQHALK